MDKKNPTRLDSDDRDKLILWLRANKNDIEAQKWSAVDVIKAFKAAHPELPWLTGHIVFAQCKRKASPVKLAHCPNGAWDALDAEINAPPAPAVGTADDRLDELYARLEGLEDAYAETKTDLRTLYAQHGDLKISVNNLRTLYDNLTRLYADLKAAYDNLVRTVRAVPAQPGTA